MPRDLSHRRLNTKISPAEYRVLAHMAQGLTNQELAEYLYLSPHTIRGHISSIYSKLGFDGASRRVKAVLWYQIDQGLIR